MIPNRSATATITIRYRVQNSLRPPPVAWIQAAISATSIATVAVRLHGDEASPRLDRNRQASA
jgi:hypothetical protein